MSESTLLARLCWEKEVNSCYHLAMMRCGKFFAFSLQHMVQLLLQAEREQRGHEGSVGTVFR